MIQPRNGLVLVRIVEEKEQVNRSGIIIPRPGRGSTFELATVVAVGPGIIDVGHHVGNEDLRAGQTVFIKSGQQMDIGQRMQTMIPMAGEEGKMFLINQQDILAVVLPEVTLPNAGPVVARVDQPNVPLE